MSEDKLTGKQKRIIKKQERNNTKMDSTSYWDNQKKRVRLENKQDKLQAKYHDTVVKKNKKQMKERSKDIHSKEEWKSVKKTFHKDGGTVWTKPKAKRNKNYK